jgi:hypothetical protein
MRWAKRLAAVDEAYYLVGEAAYADLLLDQIPFQDVTFRGAAAAISCYDWHAAVEKLEIIACMAYQQSEREIATHAALKVREAWDEAGGELHNESKAAHAALYTGRFDLFSQISR